MCWGWGVSVTREQLRKRENRKGNINEHEKGDNVPIAGFEPTSPACEVTVLSPVLLHMC